MEEKALFNLEEYKEQLIKCYSWGCDKDKNLERQQYINLLYSDEFLKGIIKNTQEFIFTLIKKMNEERRIYNFDIFDAIEYPEGKISYLTNGCMGGWFCDEIFSFTENGPLISIKFN